MLGETSHLMFDNYEINTRPSSVVRFAWSLVPLTPNRIWNVKVCLHSKNTRVSMTRKRVHWGQTPFQVKDEPEIDQLSADLTNNGVRLTQLWVIFRVKLTDFWVIVDPEWSLAPMDPFRVKF